MDTSEYSVVHFFNCVCKLTSQGCYHVGRMSQHGNLSSSPHCSITPPARGAATWGQSYCRRHQSRQAKKCVSNILRSSSSACSTWGLPFTHALLRLMPHPSSGLLHVSVSLVAILITSLHTWGLSFGCSGMVSSSLLSQFSWFKS
jgi:hypothetical protein